MVEQRTYRIEAKERQRAPGPHRGVRLAALQLGPPGVEAPAEVQVRVPVQHRPGLARPGKLGLR